jgi:predicted SnoaL-like aldol condensation-catalyzing enzyme
MPTQLIGSTSVKPKEENEEIVRRLIDEGFNKGDLSIVDEVIASDMKEHQSFGVPLPPGPAGTKIIITSLRGMFPDIKLSIEDSVTQGDRVWIRIKARGTNTGAVMGKPPSGKNMEIDVFDLCVVKKGKIVEHWGVPDQLSMLEQIGFITFPGEE